MRLIHRIVVLCLLLLLTTSTFADGVINPDLAEDVSRFPWWGWCILLFGFSFILGIFSIVAGIGGGILYVPIIGAFFPFHLDFIRGSGLLVVLTGALSAAPRLLQSGMASLRLAVLMALTGSAGSLLGANMGLVLSEDVVELGLGTVILGVVGFMCFTRQSDYPEVKRPDQLALRLKIYGEYTDSATSTAIQWRIHRLKAGFVVFFLIGFMAGMFGLGGGWANVPALNLLLGVPLKASVATSILIIAINGSAASWVYLQQGAVLPVIAVPSVAGMMLGTRMGARFLGRTNPKTIRYIVIVILIIAGIRSILTGSGVLY